MNGWVWRNAGMILTGENWSAGRKTLYSVGGRWINECGAMEEWYWQGKTEVLGEKHYTVWVVDGWMSMEQWWNDTDRGKLKYWEKDLSVAVLLYPPQISRDLTWDRTRVSALRGRRLTAHAGLFLNMFQPFSLWVINSKRIFVQSICTEVRRILRYIGHLTPPQCHISEILALACLRAWLWRIQLRPREMYV